MNAHDFDTVIIGGGTAGLSAAQMLGRARRRTLVIDAGAPRNRFAAHMHGVLGHDGVDPAELLRVGRREAERYGVRSLDASVVDVTDEEDGLSIRLSDGSALRARSIVIASGIVDGLPDVPGLRELWGSRVLHCPYCHGWEVADQRIGVLATSSASAHQIDLVRQWTPCLTAFTADLGPVDDETRRRWRHREITLVSAPVSGIVEAPDGSLTVSAADGSTVTLDALFTAPEPRIDLDAFTTLDLARTDGPGRPLAVDAVGATRHPRVWAAGNVVAPYANVPVSMGAGSMAGAAVNAALVLEDGRR